MSDEIKRGEQEEKHLDLSDFGNLSPLFANRVHVFTGPVMSRIYFGEILRTDGEISYHTAIAIPTTDLIALRDLIGRLLHAPTQ